MKIIDLLNKIANGEEVPEKILYKYKHLKYDAEYHLTYDRHYECYYDEEGRHIPSLLADNLWNLNDEVEIIEESNKIEHIGKIYDITDFKNDYLEAAQLLKDITDKQCEIIDKLNEMSDKK